MKQDYLETVPHSLGRRRNVRLYNLRAAVWRWHFYAGMLVTPLLLVVTITGALLVFDTEFNNWYYQDLFYVDPQPGPRASLETVRANILEGAAGIGDVQLDALYVYADPRRSVYALCLVDDTYYLYAFAHPNTGEYIGHYVFEDSPMRMVEQLHRRLLVPKGPRLGDKPGEIGSALVELVTSWSIILTLTGMYLWWPRNWRRIRGIWIPRSRGWPYRIWRDWHTVPAMYLSVLTMLVLVTGLVYSSWFGAGFRKTEQWAADDKSDVFAFYAASEPLDPGLGTLSPDELYEIIAASPADNDIVFGIRGFDGDNRLTVLNAFNRETFAPMEARYLLVDRQTGEVKGRAEWSNANVLSRFRLLAYPIHTGSIYGLPTQILAVAVCIGILVATLSGVVMWWKRRPKATLGLPKTPSRRVPPAWVIAAILVACVILPTTGVSLLIVLAGDRLWTAARRATIR